MVKRIILNYILDNHQVNKNYFVLNYWNYNINIVYTAHLISPTFLLFYNSNNFNKIINFICIIMKTQ